MAIFACYLFLYKYVSEERCLYAVSKLQFIPGFLTNPPPPPQLPVNNNPAKIKTKPNSKSLSTGSQIIISAGIITALTIGADFLFCKGKHIKKLFKTTPKGNTKKPNNSSVNNSHSQTITPAKPVQMANTAVFDGKSPINLGDYTPVQIKARQFAMNESSIFRTSKNKPVNLQFYMKNHSPSTFYFDAISTKYLNLRGALYPKTNRYIESTMDFIKKPSSTIFVNDTKGWYYRGVKSQMMQTPIDRISLNVYPDEQLIKKLDAYFSSGKVKGHYKTPDSIDSWRFRHDPITIYLNEPINQNIIDDVVKIANPHIRSTEDVLVGKTVMPGIAIDKSPNTDDLLKIIDEAEKYDPILADLLRTSTRAGFAKDALHGDYSLHTSAGKVAAVEALLKELKTAV